MNKKIQLIYLAILLGAGILIIFYGYQYFSRVPKKININENLISEEALQTDYSVQDINKFIKSFEMTQKMMKQMKQNKGGMKNLMKNLDMKKQLHVQYKQNTFPKKNIKIMF